MKPLVAAVPTPEVIDALRTRAEQGDAAAQANLGVMYETGRGVPQDAAEAVRWYRLAAEQGNASAQFNLGGMYASGRGVPHDDAETGSFYLFPRMAPQKSQRVT